MSLALFHPYVIGPKGVLCVKMGLKVWLTDNGAVRYRLRLPCQKRSTFSGRTAEERPDIPLLATYRPWKSILAKSPSTRGKYCGKQVSILTD